MAEKNFPGTKSDWFGFDKYEFTYDTRTCYIVVPKKTAPGKPWSWRARFFGVEPQTEVELLKQGFHVVYMDTIGMYGSPKLIAHWNAFYKYLTEEYGFSEKVALIGFSRGGLNVYNWAAANTEKVACIYADAPVCDFKSWPGGKGKSPGCLSEWQRCLEAYGFSEEQAMKYDKNPIDNLLPLAKAGIPLLHVCGDIDSVVPMDENSLILEKRYKELGGNIKMIVKKDCEHHPHSLPDPAPIVNFILEHI